MQEHDPASLPMLPPAGPSSSEGLESSGDTHPALHPSTTSVEVTPDIEALISAPIVESPDTQTPKQEDRETGPQWNATSYFAPREDSKASDSPTRFAAGAKNSADLLRRLSLTNGKRATIPAIDPRASHAGLHLSGGIISAAICIPHSVGFRSGADWELKPRRGTSALFASFSHLSDPQQPWNHTLVGWTGEIKLADDIAGTPGSSLSDHSGKKTSLNNQASTPLNKASAPVPLDASIRKPRTRQLEEGIRVSEADRVRLEKQLLKDPSGKIVPVWLWDERDERHGDLLLKDQGRWRRYAEHELYTLFHYRQHEPTDGRAERKWWADYFRLNRIFADRILEVYKPGDIVWIHDYHLLLLPSLLRQRVPNIYIGFFLHIPFPSSEYLRCLSRRKEVLTGVLGANMIGFQSYSYSRHFSSCCTRILGFDSSSAGVDAYGAHVAVDIFPIGIDATAIARTAYGDQSIEAKITRIRAQYPGQKIIVGRDRLDSVRGVSQKFMAFHMFLEIYPEWRGKVVLIQVTSPTSVEEEKDDAGHKVSNRISELVSKINGLYGGLEYTPILHFPQYISRDEYFALLRVADVGLITSTRDGMNTTSLEYIVCQKENFGPLILSEFSGTAGSLSNAIHINPWNLVGVAETIDYALTMPLEDRKRQHAKLYKRVTTNTVQVWSDNYIKRLLTNLTSFDQSIATPLLDKAKLLARYRQAKKRLFMFDYDGTLTPIVKDPQAAIPSDRVIRTVKSLASDPRNAVWIISGRDQAFLNEWMGHISELGLSAEHGSFIRKPRSDEWENLNEKTDMSWQKDVMDIFQHYTERTQGSFIERKRIALTWHFRRADPEYGAFQARECKAHLENTVAKKWEVEVMNGKANLEVRPTFVNKGQIAKRLVHEYGQGTGDPPEFVLCVGDDFTDEDMFRALRGTKLPQEDIFSVTVGASSKQTLASWHLLEPSDVIAVVALLNGAANWVDLPAVAAVDAQHMDAQNS